MTHSTSSRVFSSAQGGPAQAIQLDPDSPTQLGLFRSTVVSERPTTVYHHRNEQQYGRHVHFQLNDEKAELNDEEILITASLAAIKLQRALEHELFVCASISAILTGMCFFPLPTSSLPFMPLAISYLTVPRLIAMAAYVALATTFRLGVQCISLNLNVPMTEFEEAEMEIEAANGVRSTLRQGFTLLSAIGMLYLPLAMLRNLPLHFGVAAWGMTTFVVLCIVCEAISKESPRFGDDAKDEEADQQDFLPPSGYWTKQ